MQAGFHHLAIKTHRVEELSAFYRAALRRKEQKRWFEESGELRSAWLKLSPGILMIEKSSSQEAQLSPEADPPGFFLLALNISPQEKPSWRKHLKSLSITIESETAYTLYFRDPEGNRLALSHYPELNQDEAANV